MKKQEKHHRTVCAIMQKASKLNLKQLSKLPVLYRLTEEEKNVLINNYPLIGYKVFDLFPNYSREFLLTAIQNLELSYNQNKPFICIETQKIYNSQSECATDMFNGVPQSFSACLNGRLSTVKGYHFAYCSDTDKINNLSIFIGKSPSPRRNKEVVCIETQKIYSSIKDAEQETGITGISGACRIKKSHIAGGYHWAYTNDEEAVEKFKEFIGKPKMKFNDCFLNNGNSKAVLCVETNVVYKSTGEASRKTDIQQGAISSVCRGKGKTAGGCHWKYVEEDDSE